MRHCRLSSLSLAGLSLLAMILSCPQPTLAQDCQPGSPGRIVSGKELVEMLGSQPQVLMNCVQVKGDINLQDIRTIRGPFVLTNSSIEGSLIAPVTIFKGMVDFTNSTFSGETNQPSLVDLRESIFEGDVVWSRAKFESSSETPSSVDLRGAEFRGITD
jgi:hypothetical protein